MNDASSKIHALVIQPNPNPNLTIPNANVHFFDGGLTLTSLTLFWRIETSSGYRYHISYPHYIISVVITLITVMTTIQRRIQDKITQDLNLV